MHDRLGLVLEPRWPTENLECVARTRILAPGGHLVIHGDGFP